MFFIFHLSTKTPGYPLGVLGLDHQHTVAVAHQDVTRSDDLTAYADGEVDLTGAVLYRGGYVLDNRPSSHFDEEK